MNHKNTQIQGMGFICEASRSSDHVKVCPSPLNPNFILKHPTKLVGLLNSSHSLSKPNLDGESPLKKHQGSPGHPRTQTLSLDLIWLVQIMIHHGS